MTDALADEDDASTPLSAEEREGLIPSYITLRGELNEAEQANILEADAWAFSRRRNVLDEGFLNTLHKRMYRQCLALGRDIPPQPEEHRHRVLQNSNRVAHAARQLPVLD